MEGQADRVLRLQLVHDRPLDLVCEPVGVRFLVAEGHDELPDPQRQLRTEPEVQIGVVQADLRRPLACTIVSDRAHLALEPEVDPSEERGGQLEPRAPRVELVDEALPRQRPSVVLDRGVVDLQPGSQLDPEVPVGCLQEGPAVVDPRLERADPLLLHLLALDLGLVDLLLGPPQELGLLLLGDLTVLAHDLQDVLQDGARLLGRDPLGDDHKGDRRRHRDRQPPHPSLSH